MTQRAFVVSLILLAVAVVLSATSLGGAIAMVLLIFVGLPANFVAKTLNLGEFPLTINQFVALLVGLYALFVVVSAVRARVRLTAG